MPLFTRVFFLLICVSLGSQTQAQQGMAPLSCATTTVMGKWLQNPAARQLHQQIEQQLVQYRQANPTTAGRPNAVVTLPIVVHIVHNNGPENISDAQAIAGVQYLNQAFANTGFYNPADGVDCQIQFCLAKRDPNGNATNGITRNVSPLTNMDMNTDDIALKDLNRWNPLCYVNVWLVNEICSGGGCGVAGYAFFPSAHGMLVDGIVMEANYFGSTPGNTGVLVHEMGHYLGLYHTFQGACTNNNCLTDGDRVCDTPPDQSTAALPCNGSANSCNTDALSGFTSDQNDLHRDYMDYGNPSCFSMFTQGQAERMNWHITNVRSSLLNCPSCLDPCPAPITANFTSPGATVNAGSNFTFTNTSVNATGYEWYVNGALQSTATNFNYTFATVSSYTIKLVAKSTNPLCTPVEKMITVQAVCPIMVGFTKSAATAPCGTNINFSNTSVGATSYEWLVNGVTQSTAINFAYTNNVAGQYAIKLIARNTTGNCAKEITDTVTYTCPLSVTIAPQNPNLPINTTVNFTATAPGATTFQWLVNNIPATNSASYSFTPFNAGSYVITLIAGNGICSVSQSVFLVARDTCLRTTFQKRFGGNGNDLLTDTRSTSDGGFVYSGYTNSFGAGAYDGIVVKTNGNGNIQWNRLVGGSSNDYLNKVIPTTDGGYLAAGYTSSFGALNQEGWLVKLNSSGVVQWSRKYNDGHPNGTVIWDVCQTSDGGYAFSGTYAYTPGLADAMVCKTDANGVAQWCRRFSGSGSDQSYGVLEDNGVLVVSAFGVFNTFYDGVFMKLDRNNGSVLTATKYDIESRSNWFTYIYKQNNDYLIGCNNSNDFGNTDFAFITLRLDNNGLVKQMTRANAASYRSGAHVFTPTADGGYLLSQGESIGVADIIHLRKNTPQGNLQWLKKYGTVGSNHLLYNITQTADLSFAGSGSTNFGDFYILKTDVLGESGGTCPSAPTDGTNATPPYTATAFQWPDIGNVAIPQNNLVNPASTSVNLVATEICAGTTCVPPVDTCFSSFQKTYGGTGDEVAYHFQKTPGNNTGYIVAGFTTSYGSGGQDAYLLRLSANGDVLWGKAYGGSGNDYIEHVEPTATGGFVAVGRTQSFSQAAGALYLINVDANGNLLWSRSFGNNTNGGEVGHNVIQISDGGFVVVGAYSQSPSVCNMLVMRLDANGAILWSKTFENGSTERAISVLEENDTLLIAGYYRGGTSHDGALMKLSKANGNPYWIRGYDVNFDNNGFYRLQKIPGGYSVMTVSSIGFSPNGSKQVAIKFDVNGNVTYSHQLTSATNKSIIRSIWCTSDGGYVSTVGEGINNDDVYLYRVNSQKQLQWKKRYSRPGNQNINYIIQDGTSLAMVGLSNTAVGAPSDILFIKASANGNTPGCTTDSTDAIISDPNIASVNFTPTISDVSFTNTIPSTIVLNAMPIVATPCATVGCDTLDIRGNTTTCLSGDTIMYKAVRSNGCSLPVQWITDPIKVQVMATTDSTIQLKFLQTGTVRLFANLSTGCKVITDSLVITVENCTDTTLCGSYFNGTYTAPVDFVTSDVQRSVGRGFVTVGYRTNSGTGNDAYIMRTNNAGQPVWTRSLKGSGDDRYVKIKETGNGNLVAVGHTSSYGIAAKSLLISRYTANGDLMWSRIVNSNITTDECTGVGVEEAPGGDLLYYGKLNNGPGNSILLGRMDAAGNNLWIRRIIAGSPIITLDPTASTLHNDSLVISGNFNTGQNIGFIVKQSLTNLAVLRGFLIQNPALATILVNGITKTASGFDVSLSQNGTAAILALNDDMTVKLRRIFSSPWLSSPQFYTAPTPDNGHITMTYRADNSLALAKTDAVGQLEWIRRVDEGVAVNLTNILVIPGGYVWAGTNQASILKQGKIVKMGTDTHLGLCNTEYNISSTLSDPGLVVSLGGIWASNTSFTPVMVKIDPVIAGEPMPYFTLCNQSTLCDTVKIMGPDSACNVKDTLLYKVIRNPLCKLPVQWQINPAFGQVINSTDSTINIKWLQTGNTVVRVSIETECGLLKDSLNITLINSPDSVNLGPDVQVCDGSTRTLRAGPGFKNYTWQDGTADSIYTATYPGTYHVTVEDFCGNFYSDTLIIALQPSVPFDLGPNIISCNNDTVTIAAPAGFTGYSWAPHYNISSQQGQIIKAWPAADTVYTVIATSSPGCLVSDTIRLTVSQSPPINLGNDTSLCQGNSLLLNAGPSFNSYIWSTGAVTPTIMANTAGTYWVRGTMASGCTSTDTLRILNVFANPVVNLGNDTSLCQGNSLLLTAGAGQAAYLWSTGATTQTITVNAVGQYWVQVTNANNCTARDTMNILNIYPRPPINLGNDTSFCQGGSVTLNAGIGFANYIWSTGAVTQIITVNAAGTYWVRGTTINGCVSTDTLRILNVFANPTINLGSDTSLCMGNTNQLNAGAGFAAYQWSTGATTQTIAATTVGQYWVQITNANNCTARDTINVLNVYPRPPINLGNDTSFCQGGSVNLNTGTGFANYIWSTGAATQTITANAAGTYWVRGTTVNGCVSTDTLRILNVFTNPTINLGNDTSLCVGNSLLLNGGAGPATYIWSTGATSPTITVNAVGQYWVQVTNANNCRSRDTINLLNVFPRPIVSIGNDTSFCQGGSATLNAGPGFSSYVWNTGAATQSITASTAGWYWVQVGNAAGCTSRDSMQVVAVYPNPAISLGSDTVLCIGSSLTLSPGSNFASYLWQDGSVGNSITVNTAGTYWVQVTSGNGCRSADTMRVLRIAPLPANFVVPSTGMCIYQPVVIRGIGNYSSYQWSTGSTANNILVTTPGDYWLQVTSADGCAAKEDFVVFDKNCRIAIYFPNAFTPGADGRNDTYRPGVYGLLESFSMEIYNRYGERIFRTTDPSKGWDGTYKGAPQNTGTYVWMSTYQFKDAAPVTEKGSLVLIR